MSKITLKMRPLAAALLLPALTVLASCSSADPASAGGAPLFEATAFGQSTDLNFSTNVLPEKVGLNAVIGSDGKEVAEGAHELKLPFVIESRGGKIGNSHDGLTFYHTKVPASENFVLEALVKVENIGPENGARPAGQEGCGLLVRDIMGKARESAVLPGIEEFPAASNMVMTAVMSDGNKDHTTAKVVMIDRNGVTVPWGNAGIKITRSPVATGIDLTQESVFKLRLERTDKGFISSYAKEGSDEWVSLDCGYPNRLAVIDADAYEVGFFASRNAKMEVLDVSFTTSAGNPDQAVFTPNPTKAYLKVLGTPAVNPASDDYEFRAVGNQDGTLKVTVKSAGAAQDYETAVTDGQTFTLPVKAKAGDEISYTFTGSAWAQLPASDDASYEGSFAVEAAAPLNPELIVAGPNGTGADKCRGTEDSPCDVTTALKHLAPGGTVKLLPGDYALTKLTSDLSGREGALKHLVGSKETVFHGLDLYADYIDVNGVVVTEKSFNIAGSHNVIEKVEAHHCDDTGIWVASPDYVGRTLWAADNFVVDCESHENQDPGNINADGFAVKMRVGEGNRVLHAISWGNADDGFDLFNKIEDGPNGKVVIEDSLALYNKNNGFKMGGEGLPVPHEVRNCLAYRNGMDGFTDNFNPGQLKVENNISVDSGRFNFIYRKGPFTAKAEDQGTFSGNYSLRTAEGQYPDVVNGKETGTNVFLKDTKPAADGFIVKDVAKGDIPQRHADGSPDKEYFVVKK